MAFVATLNEIGDKLPGIKRLEMELHQMLQKQDVEEIIKTLTQQIAARVSITRETSGTTSATVAKSPAPANQGTGATDPEGGIIPPTFLPHPETAPHQFSLDPQMWGLTMAQFKQVVNYLRKQPIYEQIKAAKGFVSLYDMNRYAVIPWTQKSKGSLALLLNPAGAKCDIMASHAWGESIEELSEALTFSLEEHGLDEERKVIWSCWAAVYQLQAVDPSAPGPTIQEQLARQPFETVIQTKLTAMVSVHTSTADVYGRLWCPRELREALSNHVDVWMVASKTYQKQLLENWAYYRRHAISDETALTLWTLAGSNVKGVSLTVDTASASCSSPDDEERLRSEILRSPGGFRVLDELVLSLSRKGVSEFLRRHAGSRRHAGYSRRSCRSRRFAGGARAGGLRVARAQRGEFHREGVHRTGLHPAPASDVFLGEQALGRGFTSSNLHMGGVTARELYEASYSVAALADTGFCLHEFRECGFAARELREAEYSLGEFKAAGFTALELREAMFSLGELKKTGFAALDLHQAEFSAGDLKKAGFKALALREAEYPLGDLISVGFTALELREANFSLTQLQSAGFGPRDLKQANFSATELKRAGFTLTQLKKAGFTVRELNEAEYPLGDLISVGFTALELRKANFSLTKLQSAGFGLRDLKQTDFTARDLKLAGFGLEDLVRAKFSTTELKRAGFTATQLKEAGFSGDDIADAGFTYGQMQEAGYFLLCGSGWRLR